MTRTRALAGVATIAAFALSAAACGGGSSSPAQTTGSQGSSGASGTVDVASTSLGDVLVDTSGRTLYLFKKDTSGTSACADACAAGWPPLMVTGAPTAGGGLDAAKLGTTTRPDGTTQVTYNGHPLYRFAGDAKAGETNGEAINAFGAEWYALSPKGDAVEKKASGGGGY